MTAQDLWAEFEANLLAGIDLTKRERHIAAAAFWSGLCVGTVAHETFEDSKVKLLRDSAHKCAALTFSCIETDDAR